MASIGFPQQQQQPQQQALPIQSASSSSVDSNLLTALATYITTGPDGRSTTEQEIQEIAAQAVSTPGGRAHLESILQSSDSIGHKAWKNKEDANGTITVTKTTIELAIGVPNIKRSFTGKGYGVFVPGKAAIPIGTFYYQDFNQLGEGAVSYELHVKGFDVYIKVYRQQQHVATFWFEYIPIVFPPVPVRLTGSIATTAE
ncbi:hypothetical protein FPCIR_5537 [Fusarium pseudocircinatum]|uniref:Uncharacterized protein n=1 Tax=Fusarium pseudocircinatum TaxID=56676 RepID=A0A8H5PA23_9HYPO|nr:hypothetical protein FPCIR_5537 [Fusarium pseudocircinatum]